MKLSEILQNLDFKTNSAVEKIEIKDIQDDSRRVGKGDLFVAVSGTKSDGHDFIADTDKKGAAAIVIDDKMQVDIKSGAAVIKVKNTKDALAVIADNFYGHPSKKIKAIGITGTNGKTTTSYLIEEILRCGGFKAGIIGTIKHKTGKAEIEAKNTTPGVLELTKLFSDMASSSMNYVVMEVSSHSLDQGRIRGIEFERACFTNLTQDHLDYHKDFEGYFNAKAKLFVNLKKDKAAIINTDCGYGKRLAGLTKAKVIKCSLKEKTDAYIEDLKLTFDGMTFDMNLLGEKLAVHSPMIGRHNAYNILIASAVAKSLGIDNKSIIKAVENFRGAPGRLEFIKSDKGFKVFVDYAHTDDAISNVLKSLREVARSKIIIVFGAGGERDKTKRPKMGKAASELADHVILTSDNPRSEDPEMILKDIEKGMCHQNYEKITDRKQAIEKAVLLAKKDDIVLIAGKGHETYQVFKDRTEHFNDKEVVEEILGNFKKHL